MRSLFGAQLMKVIFCLRKLWWQHRDVQVAHAWCDTEGVGLTVSCFAELTPDFQVSFLCCLLYLYKCMGPWASQSVSFPQQCFQVAPLSSLSTGLRISAEKVQGQDDALLAASGRAAAKASHCIPE